MKPVLYSIVALCMANACLLTPAYAQDASPDKTDAALASIKQLAQINGVALACQEMAAASRAKTLMLAHAPKPLRFGGAFEKNPHNSYLPQPSSATACPDAATLSTQLDTVAVELQRTLPLNPAQAQ